MDNLQSVLIDLCKKAEKLLVSFLESHVGEPLDTFPLDAQLAVNGIVTNLGSSIPQNINLDTHCCTGLPSAKGDVVVISCFFYDSNADLVFIANYCFEYSANYSNVRLMYSTGEG